MVSIPRISKGPAGYRINRDCAVRGRRARPSAPQYGAQYSKNHDKVWGRTPTVTRSPTQALTTQARAQRLGVRVRARSLRAIRLRKEQCLLVLLQ